MSRRVVVSAVNFTVGGPLTVMQDCLAAAAATLPADWEIVALVHDEALVRESRVRAIAFPEAKTSWGRRLRLEYHGFHALSRELKPDLWLSLHDISPRVKARRQAVYCHNPAPSYRCSWREGRLERSLLLFSLFYEHLYRFNIHANDLVIVQQEWLRREFQRRFGVDRVVVAHPGVQLNAPAPAERARAPRQPGDRLVLFYPALPRVFKNFECLGEAAALLPPELAGRVEIRCTIDGSENAYAREVVQRHGGHPSMRFIGRQDRAGMAREYAGCDAVLFPSRLETWGLPITEAKAWGRPLLVADLPYAHETAGRCDAVAFLDPRNPRAWADAFAAVAAGRPPYRSVQPVEPAAPFAADWPQLWKLLVEGL